ncbi:MAG: chemotaxis protein CheX [Desulfobacula sp.]|nr:chemotaxis protein CheX [Desulfobacula sp.]
MMKTLTTAMKASISEVLETMFFLPIEFGDQKTHTQTKMDKEKANMACQLKFSGDFNGRFLLVTPKDLLIEVAENFLGESRDTLEDEHLVGTLTEMLNMICGNALSKLDSKVPFELDIPEVISESDIPGSQPFIIIKTTQSNMAITVIIE